MKFHIGEIPKSKDFDCEGFSLLKEPAAEKFERIVGVLFCLFVLAATAIWLYRDVVDWPDSEILTAISAVLVAGLIIPIHEFLHAVVYPRNGPGDVVIGFWPKKLYFYAAYTGELSRERSLLVYTMPFLVLSLLPFVIATIQDNVSPWLALVSIINAGFSSADIYIACLLISQVPNRAVVRSDGWPTYWRVP